MADDQFPGNTSEPPVTPPADPVDAAPPADQPPEQPAADIPAPDDLRPRLERLGGYILDQPGRIRKLWN